MTFRMVNRLSGALLVLLALTALLVTLGDARSRHNR